MSNLVKEFNDYRARMNEVILSKENLVIKRLWNLDTNTYAEGALDVKTKELLGLVARTPNCQPPRRPATWTCGPRATLPGSSTTTRAR